MSERARETAKYTHTGEAKATSDVCNDIIHGTVFSSFHIYLLFVIVLK